MHVFTLIFLLTLICGAVMQTWLIGRQRRHVEANRAEVPAAFARRVSLAEHHKAADYTLAKTNFARIELLYSTALLLLFTLGGGLNQMDRLWHAWGFSPLVSGMGLAASLLLLLGILDIPFSLWRTFVLEDRFGFNRTTVGRFLLDLATQAVLLLLLGMPLLWTVLWLMQEAGDYWWLYAWLVWIGFMLLMTWAYPTLIAPLFNRFTPLEEGDLKERIQRLLGRCGFTSSGVFVMDGSRRSGHGNAYFTGLGKQKRIVFFDTLLESLAPDEMEAVLAHELGHFKRRHIMKQLLVSALLTLLGMAMLGWLAGERWFYQGLGVSRESDAMALLLFLMVVPVFTQFPHPLISLMSRRYEFEADAFAREHTGAEPLISALVKLNSENASTLTPDPIYSAFHDSHPPAPVRVAHLADESV